MLKMKILVIDDEESIRYTFKEFLTDAGYEVETVSDYDEAITHIRKNDFDLIFVDIILGDRSGIEILRDVKKRSPSTVTIIITGYPDVESASEAVRLGAFDYISKPIDQEMLFHVTRKAIEHKILIDEKERYRSNLEAIFRSVKDGIITVDKRLKIIQANEAAQRICGLLSNFTDINSTSIITGCKGKCIEALQRTINIKEVYEVNRFECSYNNNLQKKVLSISTAPLLNEQGIFSGAVLVIRDETHLNELERNLRERKQFHNIVGESKTMQKIYALIEDLADLDTTVLITGESGTGKELVAEALHYRGNRADKPLVKVNCTALSENLLESELFGHVKGAFTGAERERIGRFQKANTGTIFLDEIGDISLRLQLRLLRVLQEKEIERVGDSTPIKIDVRIIAATNRNLREKVRRGEFREDLYYRLKVVEIFLPPLRERKEDIFLLVRHFLERFNKKFNKHIVDISEDVKNVFMAYDWPGNVRELKHTLEYACIRCRQSIIEIEHLPQELLHPRYRPYAAGNNISDEPDRILQALNKTGWNKSKAARMLGISVRTIYRKIERFNLKEPPMTY
jgi:PAS domain S-box-containing protein